MSTSRAYEEIRGALEVQRDRNAVLVDAHHLQVLLSEYEQLGGGVGEREQLAAYFVDRIAEEFGRFAVEKLMGNFDELAALLGSKPRPRR